MTHPDQYAENTELVRYYKSMMAKNTEIDKLTTRIRRCEKMDVDRVGSFALVGASITLVLGGIAGFAFPPAMPFVLLGVAAEAFFGLTWGVVGTSVDLHRVDLVVERDQLIHQKAVEENRLAGEVNGSIDKTRTFTPGNPPVPPRLG